MAKTYAQLAKEIETLTSAAAALRKREIPGVVSRIKEAIAIYGLSAADLGFDSAAGRPAVTAKSAPASAAPVRPASAPAGKVAIKYRDAHGHSWSGRGSKPGWLVAALAAGQSLQSLSVAAGEPAAIADFGAATSNAGKPANRAKAGSAGGKAVSTVKYRDSAGHAWSGRGPKPGWFKAALASGKTPEQLAV